MGDQVVGFVGLGNMGLPMAANLAKAGRRVLGYDIAADNMTRAGPRGIAAVGSLAELARDADVIVTMLPAGTHVLEVWRGLVGDAKRGTLIIDCSTIDVASARAAHDMAAAAGLAALDAPVSGGVGGAEAATLTFMVGGAADAVSRGRGVLDAMGKRVVHCGTAGSGQAAKICNNMLLGISMIGAAEAFVLAEKLGLSHQALFDVASTSSGQCWSVTTYCPVPGPVPTSPANRDYQPGFASILMVKDLMLAQEAARQSGAATPLGAEAAQLYQQFCDAGNKNVDFSGIIKMLRGA